MTPWADLLRKPDALRGRDDLGAWFTAMAARLLNGAALLAGGVRHRFTEVEFYYHGDGHPDTFAHRDPIQLLAGRWYFHRTGGVYRSGSFKGLDLSFGDGKAHGGVLIRGLATEDDTLIDGPSLCVDHLLRLTAAGAVPTLDKVIGERPAWDGASPLRLEWVEMGDRPVLRSARVGLSLKRSGKSPEPPRFVGRPYRHLTEPRRIGKGKPHMVLSLHASGADAHTIRQTTGGTKQAIARYVADFEAGKAAADFAPFRGNDLGPRELCRMLGVWHANYGTPTT